MNASEPLGLPNGSIRAILTLGITGVTLYLFAIGQSVPVDLLVVNTLVVGNYFGLRSDAPKPVVEEIVDAPFIPGETNG